MKYKAFHKLSYGLYIITTEWEGKKAGYIANTAFQVTSFPPQLAISSHKENDTTGKILKSGRFAVSILKKEVSTALIGEFGFMTGSEVDKFRNVETLTAATGAPVVTDSSVAWFDCKVVQSIDVGSHFLIVGEVLESEVLSEEEPLTYEYYREKYKMLAPKHAPTYIEKEKLENESSGDSAVSQTETKNKAESAPDMSTYTCSICGFQYDPEEGDPSMGIPPGTSFEDLPEEYKCPICNAGKDYFRKDW